MLLQLAVILQLRTEVNEVTNVVATWKHQIKTFMYPTCPNLLSCVSVRCPYDVRASIRTEGSGDKWNQHWYEQLETNEEAATEEILRVANT